MKIFKNKPVQNILSFIYVIPCKGSPFLVFLQQNNGVFKTISA